MATALASKLPIFHKDTHDAREHLFILENDWEIRRVSIDEAKILDFTTSLRDEIVKWFMKYKKVSNLSNNSNNRGTHGWARV